MAKLRYLKNIITLQLNTGKCVGCGRCMEVCPHGVFVMESKKARILYHDACMECGACAKNCPTETIFVKSGVGCSIAVINTALRRKKTPVAA